MPWEWDKHNYQGFEVEVCPPWSSNQGLFPHPPMPSELTSKVCLTSEHYMLDVLPDPACTYVCRFALVWVVLQIPLFYCFKIREDVHHRRHK